MGRESMQTFRFPLTAILATRNDAVGKDGLLVNCYEEDTPIGKMIVKRPGLDLIQSFGAGQAQGAITFNDSSLFILNDSIVSGLNFVEPKIWNPGASNPFSGARIGTAICDDGSALYATGGSGTGATAISSDVWKSLDDGFTWTLVNASASFGARAFHQMFSLSGVLYVIGGYTTKIAGVLSVPVATVWKSSNQGVTWTAAGSMSAARAMMGGSVLGTNVVIAGGVNGAGALLNSVEKFNGTTWTTLTASAGWTARRGHAVCTADGNLYLAGGAVGVFSSPANFKNDVWRSRDGGVSWTQLTAAGAFTARQLFGLSFVNSKFLIYGGSDSSGASLNDVYESFDAVTWTNASVTAPFSARAGFGFTNHTFPGTGETALLYGGGTVNISATATFTATRSDVYSSAIVTGTALSLSPPIPNEPFQMVIIPQSGTTPEKVFIKNANIAYIWDGAILTQVTDADYPLTTVWGVVYLDGVIYVMDATGQINGSDLNDPLSWNALNFIAANSTSDRGIALVRQLNYIVAFKEFSTEFFYDAGNATGSPLAKVLNAFLEIGLASAGSLAFADNTVYFMANAKQKGRTIMKMDGYSPKYVSTPYIDRILNGSDLSSVYAFVVKSNGHFFYVLTLVDLALTLVLDEVTGKWHTWSSTEVNVTIPILAAEVQDDGTILISFEAAHGQSDGTLVQISGSDTSAFNTLFTLRYDPRTMGENEISVTPFSSESPITNPITGTMTASFYSETFFPAVYYAQGNRQDHMLDRLTGDVYSFEPSTYQDVAKPITVHIRTALIDMDLMASKRYNRLELVGDKVNTQVYVRHTDDDYQTWSLYRAIKMNINRAKISNLGSARRRAFELQHADNTELRLLAAEIDADVGVF